MRKNSIQRLLLAVLSMMLVPIMATATPAILSIEDFTINAGETKEMLIDLENPNTTVTLVQFDLRLPDGVSIAKEDGEFVIDIAGRTTWRKHSLGANTINDITRFLLSSQTNAVISGTNGAIISIMLVADDSFNGGAIVLENQLIVTPDKEETKPADYTYIIPSPSVAVITADDKTRDYGDDNPELTYQVVEGTITGQPSLTTTATTTSPVGIYDIVVSRGSIEGNYTANNGHLTVTKAPLTITAYNYTVSQGQAMPQFSAIYSGFKNNETKDVLTTQPIFTTTAESTDVPGTYDIIVSGAEAQNYEISYVKGTLTVNPHPKEVYEVELPTTIMSFDGLNDVILCSMNKSDFTSRVLQKISMSDEVFYNSFEADIDKSAYTENSHQFIMNSYIKGNSLHPGYSKETNPKGRVYYTTEADGSFNGINWRLTAEEADALTRDNAVGVLESIIHFIGATAPYDDIYIKMEVRLNRQSMPVSQMSIKNENYWFSIDGQTPALTPPLAAIACNTTYPQDGLSTVPWRNSILSCFDNDKIKLTNSTGSGKLYFVPKEYEIKASDGTVYVVTPKRGKDDNVFNKFINLYDSSHTHNYVVSGNGCGDETANRSILNQCAICYQPDIAGIANTYNIFVSSIDNPSAWPKCDGVFSNDTLYAIRKTEYNTAREYEPIAIITNTGTNYDGGQVVLLHEYVENKWLLMDAQPSGNKYTLANFVDKANAYTEACLNAVGYVTEAERDMAGLMTGAFNDKCNPLNEQLRAYIGVITGNRGNLANPMTDESKLFATFQNTWERPINMVVDRAYLKLNDAESAGVVYALDVIKLFDYRGASRTNNQGGYMWDNQTWLWSFYGVKNIQIDLRLSSVMVNINGSRRRLNPTTDQIYVYSFGGNTLTTFPLNLSSYNNQASNDGLKAYMESDKNAFGYIKIENGSSCPQNYILYIPIQIEYDWGVINDNLVINVSKAQLPTLDLSASPQGGEIEPGTTIELTVTSSGSAVNGADIYYTLDGTDPSQDSTKYTSSGIIISEACTLKAIAYKDGYETSDILVESYTIMPDGVDSISSNTIEAPTIYNLSGQRLSKPQRGVNIINGRKVVVK